jgi:glycosyltransferase involved in cell wall biosynthesis
MTSDQDLPLVSIITPSFNQAQYLEQTIQSVLLQDYPNIEYLLVDGGSTDGSLEIIQRYASRIDWWVSEPDRGQAEAINKGFHHANGQIVGWLNSDDLYYGTDTVSQAVHAFGEHPGAGMVYANGLKINSDGTLIDWFRYPQYDMKDLLSFKVLLQPASFMRQSALEEAQYLPQESNLLLDHELWLQIAVRHPLIHVDGFWAVERSHDTAKTISLAAHYGPDAFVLFENLKKDPLFAPTIHQYHNQILAGIHIFHARRLIDAKKPANAMKNFWQAAKLYPTSLIPIWFKVLQAFAGMLGLGNTMIGLRDTSRRIRNHPQCLVVDDLGFHWRNP